MFGPNFIHRSLRLLPVGLFLLIVMALQTGCSAPAPHNPEPTLEPLETSQITRTEAILMVRVSQRSTGRLTHAAFHYGESGRMDNIVPVDNPDASIYILHLTDLSAGTSYSWYLEGRTSTATLTSEIMSFTTLQNDIPTLSPLTVLSTGPVGMIVTFDIIDDGGEEVTEAGCEIVNELTRETKRFYLPSTDLAEGAHRLNVGGLSPQTPYTLTPFASNSIGEIKGESMRHTTEYGIILAESGVLARLFDGNTEIGLDRLSIAGEMNGDDFRFLRLLLDGPVMPGGPTIRSSVAHVDLRDVRIVEGGGTYDGSRFTTADEVSTGLFSDCRRLTSIVLPNQSTTLARDAFAGCSALEELTVSAETSRILPSADCPSLRRIDVSEANTYYTSVDGVLLEYDGREIVWFPLGKDGDYVLPATVVRIGEYAFSGARITSLTVPESVTSIGRGAFAGSALEKATLPDNLTLVPEGLFQNCGSLREVHLGRATELIYGYFVSGTPLSDLYIAAPIPPVVSDESFINRDHPLATDCTLHVPEGCKNIYRNHPRWGSFAKIVEY